MGRLMPDTEFPDVGDGWQKKDQIIVTEIPLDTDQTPESPRRLHTSSSDERNRGAEIIEQPKSVAEARFLLARRRVPPPTDTGHRFLDRYLQTAVEMAIPGAVVRDGSRPPVRGQVTRVSLQRVP